MVHSGTSLVDPNGVFQKIGLAPGMRVADLGSGRTGHFVFPAAEIVGEHGIVYAVDIMKDVLKSLESMTRTGGFNNIKTVWSDIERPGKAPIPDRTLDVCFMVNVMFQLKDRAGAISEAARLLKKGGYLAVIDWKKKLGMLGPGPGQMVDQNSLAEMAARDGLKLIDKLSPGDYHFCIIFQKA